MFRHVYGHAGTPVQQSMTIQDEYYSRESMSSTMLGIVVDVMPADSQNNESAQRSQASRGFMPQCSVLVISGSSSSSIFLDKVYILPDSLTGVNDYCEHLPRGSTRSLSGSSYNSSLVGINPLDLDGEWCIVSFLGGHLDQPFILKWWPHPRNTFDPLTSGNGNPDSSGTPHALNQTGRYFKRINGVEHVITKDGDVYLSTHFAGSTVAPEVTPKYGRAGMHTPPFVGGNIKVTIKPSQQLELNFNEYADGLGVDRYDDSLPQTNPKTSDYNTATTTGNTSLRATQDTVSVYTPSSLSLVSSGSAKMSATDELTIFSGGSLTTASGGSTTTVVDGDTIQLTKGGQDIQALQKLSIVAGYPSSTADALAPLNMVSTGAMTIRSGIITDPGNPPVTPAQPANINVQATGNMHVVVGNAQDGNIPPADLNLEATGKAIIEVLDMLNLQGSEVNLGTTASLPTDNAVLLKQFQNDASFTTAYATLAPIPAAVTPTDAVALVNAVNAAFKALVSALKNTATTVTKAT